MTALPLHLLPKDVAGHLRTTAATFLQDSSVGAAWRLLLPYLSRYPARQVAYDLLEDVNLHSLNRALRWRGVPNAPDHFIQAIQQAGTLIQWTPSKAVELALKALRHTGDTEGAETLDHAAALDRAELQAALAEMERQAALAEQEDRSSFPAQVSPPVQDPEWTSAQFGRVYVQAPKGAASPWWNIGAEVGGKRYRFGWNATDQRWARKEIPPAELLEEAQQHGWSFWTGSGATGTRPSAPPPAPEAASEPQQEPAASIAYKPPYALALTEVNFKDVREGDIAVSWASKGSTAWVQIIHPQKIPGGYMFPGTTIATSIAEGRKNRIIYGNSGSLPAPDFTFANIVYRRGAYDYATYKSVLIPGWGSALIRYYLDKLGIPYDPDARFLYSAGSTNWIDITAPVEAKYPGPKPEGPVSGSPDVKPAPGDVVIRKDGSRFDASIAGRARGSEQNGIPEFRSTIEEGTRTWTPHTSSYLVSRLLSVDAPDFTEGVLRSYGTRLVNKYLRWASDTANRIRAIPPTQRGTLLHMPEWRSVGAAQDFIPEIPAALPPGARVLYKPSASAHYEDVTNGTASGSLGPVKPPIDHPLYQAIREETKPFNAEAFAQKFRDLAARMDPMIESKLHPAIGEQNLTHRRAGITASMQAEGRSLRKMQGVLRALADAAEAGTLPSVLKRLTARTEVEMLATPWIRIKKDIAYNEQFHRPHEIPVLQAALDTGDISRIPKVHYPGTWGEWKGELSKVREKAPRTKAGRIFINWASELSYSSSASPPPAAADAIVELGPDIMSPMALDLARSAKRAHGLGFTDPLKWIEALNAFYPIWRAGLERGAETPAERRKREEQERVRGLIGTTIPGFFPTPQTLAMRVVSELNAQPGDHVLEPSAGKGDLVDALLSMEIPDLRIDVVEYSETLRKILQAKGYEPVAWNFMEYAPGMIYDRVLMNPPFENGQDMQHVMHAFELLKPGGRLVAIMSRGPFVNSSTAAQRFRHWLDEIGGVVEELPEGSFTGKESFRQTGTNTSLVVVDK